MNLVFKEGFTVMGRAARTSNARETTGQGVIGSLWAKLSPDAKQPVAVYFDYATNKDGEYGYLLGLRANENDTLPIEFEQRFIETGDYFYLKSDGPRTAQAVIALWQQVWALEESGKLTRRYLTDFEVYTPEGVELYVGVTV